MAEYSAAAKAPEMTNSNQPRAEPAGYTKAVKLGFVGCGPLTRRKHLRLLGDMPELEVVAVADMQEDLCSQTAEQYGIAGRYPDVHALLEHPGLEAVAVVVPSKVHADVAIAALQAGKHVLIEKPLSDTLEAAQRILDAAAGSSAQAMMAFYMRFHRLVRQARRLLAEGAVGNLETIRTVWYSPWLNPQEHGKISHREMRHRHHEGALIDIGMMGFDLWRALTGAEVESLWAQVRDGARQEETATVNARLTNGVLATGTFSTQTTQEIEIEVCGSKGRLRVACQRFDGLELLPLGVAPGSAHHRLAGFRRLLRELPAGLGASRRGGIYLDAIARQWHHFAQAVRGATDVESTLDDGWQALRITLAARASAATGQPVQPADPISMLS